VTAQPVRRSFLELAGQAAVILTIWAAFAVFSSSEFQRRIIDSGEEARWAQVLRFQMTSALVWALFTPPILSIAERLPLRYPNRLRNTLLLLLLTPLLSVTRAAFGGLVNQLGEGVEPELSFIILSVNIRFVRNVVIILAIIGIANLILAQRHAAERERRGLALKTAITNAELRRLQAGMQPRFLFAMLDAVAAEVRRAPSVAEAMLVRLGQLLRGLRGMQTLPDAPLRDQLDLIDHAFELERIRTSGRFLSRIDIDEEWLDTRVSPLLLYAVIDCTLLGHAGETVRRVEVLGHVDGSILTVSVHDRDADEDHAEPTANGPRARLVQLFGDHLKIDFRTENGSAVTELRLPLTLDQEEAES
jgi:two-component system, LytTR family, sensor kinase